MAGNCFYTGLLAGLFATSLAVFLKVKRIYLLGMDWTKSGVTHYYDNIQHRGVGQTAFYEKFSPSKFWDNFESWDVWNVSPESNIETFPKIDYDTFFEHLREKPVEYAPDELRQWVAMRLGAFKIGLIDRYKDARKRWLDRFEVHHGEKSWKVPLTFSKNMHIAEGMTVADLAREYERCLDFEQVEAEIIKAKEVLDPDGRITC